MEYPISLDTALTLVNGMKGVKSRLLKNTTNQEDKLKIKTEIDVLNAEEEMLYGADDLPRLSVMEKVIKIYSPTLKQEYASY